MKKILNRFIAVKQRNMQSVAVRAREMMISNAGESESTGSVILIIGAVVVGALVIGCLITLFKSDLWPMVTEAIKICLI